MEERLKKQMDFSSESYKDVSPLNEKHGVFLVRDEEAGRMCVKKILKTYNVDVYERLQTSRVKGIPEIYQMQENDGELTRIVSSSK